MNGNMYAKIFASIFEGSMRGKPDVLLVWLNMLAHAAGGICDRSRKTISDETGLSDDRVKAAIMELEAPDPQSRSPDKEGRRIVRVSDHRDWGWRLVNWEYYRSLMSETDKREKDAERQRNYRLSRKGCDMGVTGCDRALRGVTPASASASAKKEGEKSARGEGGNSPACPKPFQKPSHEEADAYGCEIDLPSEEIQKFMDYFTSNGWKVGRAPMKDWRAAMRNWQRRTQEFSHKTKFKPKRRQWEPGDQL